ncbi:Ubiquitin-like protein [Claviceps sp. LM220 group G6]|nr:Ubiquitin-like protein [Claviceps sp. LM220 group G6]
MDQATTSSPSSPPPPLQPMQDKLDRHETHGQQSHSSHTLSPPIPDEDDDNEDAPTHPDNQQPLPLTMTTSVLLADLPRDATAALATAGTFPQEKVVVRFKPVGSAPSLAQELCKITATRKFEEVVRYLRRKLKCGDSESVFLYVNSAFAPSLDEVVGNLYQCFKNGQDQLVVAYSMTPAFG